MPIGKIAKKIKRNVEDYGWRITIQKTLARTFGFVYEKRVYRIYRINIQGAKFETGDTERFQFKLLSGDDQDLIAQVESMAEWLENQLANRIGAGDICLAAIDDDRVAGFNVIAFGDAYIPLLNWQRHFRKHDAWSEHIGVHRDYRRMGLASQLRYRIFEELDRRGCKRLLGGALTSNVASLKLARRVGFREFADVHYRRLVGFESRRVKRVRL